MKPWESRLNHLANLGVGGTGLVYGWMLYLAVNEDPFAIVNHPWQPEVREAHILLAPLLVFAVGLLWREHAWARFRSKFRARRKTGLVLMALFFPMVLSGYLLQTSASEAFTRAWVWIHVASSCLWILVYLVHQVSRRPKRRPGTSAS